jgi:hypothetical protein
MIKLKKTLLICLITAIVSSQFCFSQAAEDTIFNTTPQKVDTFTVKYDFQVGDTLIYFINSKDSITIDYAPPLLKIRFEKIMLTCDSITPEGHFIIKQQLIDFKSKESYLNEQTDRNFTPWLNIPVYMEIDSMGNRFKQYNEDTLSLATPPGGVFQPFLLMPLMIKDSATNEYPANQKSTIESWLIKEDSCYIVENGMPMPMFRYAIYYRMQGMVDTLDLKDYVRVGFSMTSQSSHGINTEEVKMITTSINNAGGEIFWDTAYYVPKFIIYTIEQRLTIEDRIDRKKINGFHHIYSNFVLDKIIRKKDN